MNISDLSSIIKLASLTPNDAKTLVKLLSVDVLKNLGNDTLLLQSGTKTLNVKSDINLDEGTKAWVKIATLPDKSLLLKSALLMPKLMQNLNILQDTFNRDTLQSLLKSNEPLSTFKKEIIELMASATSKEQFSALSQLLLSLNHNVLTIPLEYQNYYAVFQMKKRYNKDSKKRSLDFYAELETLGPIEGTLSLIEGEIYLHMNVAFEESAQILESSINELSFFSKTTIQVKEHCTPLFNQEQLSLLDITL